MLWADRHSVERTVSALVADAERARRRGDDAGHDRALATAAAHLHRAGDLDAAMNMYLSLRDYAAAAMLAEQAQQWERAAQVWYRAGEFERAARALELGGESHRAAELFEQVGLSRRAARIYARDDQPLLAAAAYERASDPRRAAQCYVTAMKDPRRYEVDGVNAERVCRAAALCFESAGEIDRAVRVLELGGQRFLAAEVLRRAGREEEAERLLTDCRALQAAEVLLARARAGEKRLYDDAIQSLASISEDQASYVEARVLLAQSLVEQRDAPCALRVLQRLLAHGMFTREHLAALYLYGKLLVKAGRQGEARGTFRSIVEIDPDYEDAATILRGLGETGSLDPLITETLAEAMIRGEEPRTLIGSTLRDRFEITRHLSEGAQAEVYEARDLVLDRPVAIKVLRQEQALDPVTSEAFLQEARFAARVHHRGCLGVYDFGADQGVIFMAMALLDGHTLEDSMAGRALEPSHALSIAREVTSALAAVHDAGIIHRDVKPKNIMIDRSGAVRLADFGVATSLEGASSESRPAGTLRYMAPEQGDPTCVDPRSDVYSMGVLLYEMLAGDVPFEGSIVSLVARVLQPAPALPDSVAVPAYVARIVQRCLEPDPDDRWPSMRHLFVALDEAVSLLDRDVVTKRRTT